MSEDLKLITGIIIGAAVLVGFGSLFITGTDMAEKTVPDVSANSKWEDSVDFRDVGIFLVIVGIVVVIGLIILIKSGNI